jgi:hypothetical protein
VYLRGLLKLPILFGPPCRNDRLSGSGTFSAGYVGSGISASEGDISRLEHMPKTSTPFDVSIYLYDSFSLRRDMKNQIRLEPCMACDKSDCQATLILPNLSSTKKHFNPETNCFDLICPACNRPFSISIFKLAWLEVDEIEFMKGFFGGKRVPGSGFSANSASVPRSGSEESGGPR